jgi:polar amino acid transport system permease protein
MYTQQALNLPHIYFIAEGAIVTLKYSVCSVLLGLIIGIILAICKVSKKTWLKIFADLYTSIFRGTPLLVQLSIVYFGLPSITGIKLSIVVSGIITFSLNSGAYVSEIIRAGINGIDKGQFEAAKALSIPESLMMKDIILPQAIRNILPSLVNELINLIKESAILSMIGEMDIMHRAQIVSQETYTYFTPMLTAAACYYVMVLVISNLAKLIEKKLAVP